MNSLHAQLQQHFGYGEFRPGQLEAVRPIMQGRDAMIVMPTGAGKSLCFQLPALLQEGTAIVISPLIALMKDQTDALTAQGIAATCIHSALDANEASARLQAFRQGRLKMLYVAPERLKNLNFRTMAQQVAISFIAVDEAHCISQWGHDFRPDYLDVNDFVETIGRPPVVALTATATPFVQDDIERQLHLQLPHRQVTGFNRPNLHFEVRFTPDLRQKQQALLSFIGEHPKGTCGVIYVGRRRDVDDVTILLRQQGYRVVGYHGGMPGWERDQVQEQWTRGEADIVVATNAFGMGVDKANVRFVVHYTLPGTVEAYYQEAGRAGRDGEPAQCLLLSDPQDARLHEFFIENDAPELEELRTLYAEVRNQARTNGGRLMTTAGHLAAVLEWKSDIKVRTGLKLLEEANLIEEIGEQNGVGQWRLLPVQGRVDMSTPLRGVEQRRQVKYQLLKTIIEYSNTYLCRRQFLLDYFGDATPPLAEVCCDNCQRAADQPSHDRAASSPEEKAALWILDAVNNLSYGIGRTLLTQILSGSRASKMEKYFQHPQFGILRHWNQQTVKRLVDDLIRDRYLQIESGQYPTLVLTSLGKQAVDGRFALKVSVGIQSVPVPSSTVRAVPKQTAASTAQETFDLFKAGMSAEEIASERGLTVGTVYNHLAALIESGTIHVSQVVPDPIRRQIEEAVRDVGSFYLSPIKARLPDDISYGTIRCVVQAMQRENPVLPAPADDQEQRRAVVDKLTAWRKGEAARVNQPVYFIISNAMLYAIAHAMPATSDDLAALGLAPHVLDTYGDQLLQLVQ